MRLLEPSVVAPLGGKPKSFLGIIFEIIEVFGPDGSFVALAGFRIATNKQIWLLKRKRLPTPALAEWKVPLTEDICLLVKGYLDFQGVKDSIFNDNLPGKDWLSWLD